MVGACASDSASAKTAPFTVWVLDDRLTVDGDDTPLANVRVAFDPPGGGARVVKTTEPDGHVTFDGDFARGAANVSVFSPDHVFVTMLEASPDAAAARPNTIGKPAQDLVVFPPRLDTVTESRTVELRGTITGKQDPNNVVSLAVSTLGARGTATALETSYALRVPKDRPTFLLGHETKTLLDADNAVVSSELVKSFRIDLEPRADDELLDLDLPALKALPTHPLRATAEAPREAGTPFVSGTRAYASIASADSGLVVGLFSTTTPKADFTFDLGLTFVETDIGQERLVSQSVLVSPDGSRAVRTELGPVADGYAWKDFPLPPRVANPDAARVLTDPIPLEDFPAGADLEAAVFAGGQLFWILRGPPGSFAEKELVIPDQGEVSFPANVQLFAVSIAAKLDRVPLPPHGEMFRRSAIFRDVTLRKN